MAKKIKMTSFVYPGCILVCDTTGEAVCGSYPEIARIFHDRSVKWMRKRVSDQMRTYVEKMASEPFVAISDTQHVNFFER